MGLPKSIHVHGSLSDISVLAEPAFPIISATAITCIDCGNFYDVKYNDLFYIVDFQESNAVSTSYIRTFFNENVLIGNADFIYKIRSSYSGKVHFGLRCAFTTEFTGCTLNFYYSNVLALSVNLTLDDIQDIGGFNRFYFVYDNFITFDSDARDFKIQVTGAGVLLDSIVFNKDPINEIPDIQSYFVSEHDSYPIFCLQSSLDESISLSFQNLKKKTDCSSLTLHMQLYLLDKEQDTVIGFLKCGAFLNTNSMIFDNGWVSFNLEYFMAYSAADQESIINGYRVGISLVGCHKNENLYFIWSQSDRTDNQALVLKKNDSGSLEVSNYNLSIKMFESRDVESTTGDIVTAAPEIEKLIISKFSKYYISKSFNSTINSTGPNSEEIVLKLPDRTVTFLIDMSGSMTWNDPDGDRLNVASDILDRFAGGYPGNLNYQVITFGGTPILTEWFGVTESKVNDTSDAIEVKRKAFFDEAFKFYGVQIVRKKGRAPATPTDGDIVYSGYTKIFYDTNLESNAEYYYAIFSQTDDGRFSNPVIVKAVPEPRLVPAGIKNLNGISIKASGIPKDNDTLMLLHMDEGSDIYVHDFSYGSIFEYENTNDMFPAPLWIDKSESPASSDDLGSGKGSGIRFNGSSEFLKITDNKISILSQNEIGIMVWVYPFSSNSSTLDEDMGLLKIQLSSGENIKVNIQTDGTIFVDSPFGSFVSSITVDTNSWNHICIFSNSNSSRLYINGVSEILTSIFEPSVISDLEIGRSSTSEFFFGKITEFSLHSSIRSDEYVYGHYQSIPSWNGDNIVVLRFTVPSSYIDGKTRYSIRYKPELGPLRHISDDISGPANHGNYVGFNGFTGPDGPNFQPEHGLSARLVFGDDIGPSNPEDGENVISGIINKTYYRHVIVKNFASRFNECEFKFIGLDCPGFRHFFRVFIINDKDISSLPEDSGLFQYNSPIYRERMGSPDVNIPSVKNVEVLSGDSKVYLKWNTEYSEVIRNVVIFFSRRAQPDLFSCIGIDEQSSFLTEYYPVFIGDINSSEFVFRKGIIEFAQRSTDNPDSPFGQLGFARNAESDLLNGSKAYFSIYTRDKYGNYGEPVKVTAIPNIGQDELDIPPDLVFAIRSQPVDDTSVSIKWINPSRIRHLSDISCWLDDRIVFYFKATDIFGRKLETEYDFKFRTTISSTLSSADQYTYTGYIVPNSNNQAGNASPNSVRRLYETPTGFTDSVTVIRGSYDNNDILFDPERQISLREILYFSDISKTQEVKNSSDGYYKIFFDLSNADSDQLSAIYQAYFVAIVSLKTSKDMNDSDIGTVRSFDAKDSFEYMSFPIRVLMTNPFSVQSYNSTSAPYPVSWATAYSIIVPNPCEILGNGFGGDNSLNENSIEAYGCYVTRKNPYSILIRATYKGKPLPAGFSARVYVFNDDNPEYYHNLGLSTNKRFTSKLIWGGQCHASSQKCDQGQTEWGPDPHLGSYSLSNLGVLDNIAEFNEHSSGFFSECLYKIPVPLDPYSIRVVFKLEQDGIFACPQNYLNFVNNLNININTVSPIADGKNIARQSCFAYTVDPDYTWADGFSGAGFQQQFFTPVPDFTPIQWEILKYRNTSERPFYSTASINDGFFALADGVFDFTQDGYSRNVFFGPASGVIYQLGYRNGNIEQIPEEYSIRATVVYNGKRVSAMGSACIHPLFNSSVDNPELPSIKKSAILCCASNGNYLQNIYSDGKDFASFIVAKDPEITYTDSSDILRSTTGSFLKCYNSVLFPDSIGMDSAYITKISTGKPVFIETIKINSYSNPEIKYWQNPVIINYQNIVVSTQNGSIVAIGEKSAINNTIVSMEESNNTEFAISSNAFIPIVWSKSGDPTIQGDVGVLCSHIHDRPYQSVGSNEIQNFVPFIDYDIEIKASTSEVVNGLNIDLISPGNWGTGNPPKFIKFIEPLRIDLAYILVDGERNTAVKIDGVSYNRLVFVATFAGRNISTSSPIRIYECGTSLMLEGQGIVFCEIKEDPFFVGTNYSGNPIPGYKPGPQSFFYVDLDILNPLSLIDSKIFAECNYDESGSIVRQRVLGVNIKYTPSAFSGGESFLPPGGGEDGSSSSSDNSFNGQDSGTGFFVGGDGGSFGFVDNSSSSSNNIPFLEPEPPPQSRPLFSSLISDKCYVYDLSLESQPDVPAWYRIADMRISKMFHSTCFVGGKIYAIGGINGAGITSYTESWDPATNQWSSRSPMPEPKYGMQSCNDNRYIYCFGGVEMYLNNIGDCSGNSSIIDEDSPPFGGGGGAVGGSSSSSLSGSSSSSGRYYNPRVSTSVHRYDTRTDQWISLKSMPILDINGNDISDSIIPPNLSIIKYGIAFGQAHIINGNIYIVCGTNNVHLCQYEPIRMNDRVLVYHIQSNRWSFTEELSDIVKATYQRVHSSSFVDNSGRIIIFGGTKYIVENPVTYSAGGGSNRRRILSKNHAKDTCYIDINSIGGSQSSAVNADIGDASYLFDNLPFPREMSSCLVLNDDVYVLGGRIHPEGDFPGTPASKKFERLNLVQSKYIYEKLEKPNFGIRGFGMVSDGVGRIIYCGGFSSNETLGYTKIDIHAYGEQTESNTGLISRFEDVSAVIRLDGRSSCDLVVTLYDDEGDLLEEPVNVELYGSIKFPLEDDFEDGVSSGQWRAGVELMTRILRRRGTRVYPIQITPSNSVSIGGKIFAKLLPRTEDPLRTISEITAILNRNFTSDQIGDQSDALRILQNVTRFPYQIVVSANIIDDFYFGSTTYNPVSSSSSSAIYDQWFPELNSPDSHADAGEFEGARSLPPFKVINTEGIEEFRPSCFGQMAAKILMTKQNGLIATVGDSDLFGVTVPKTGSYKISITVRGFSDLKAKLKIFHANRSPYIVCPGTFVENGTNQVLNRFLNFNDIDGCPECYPPSPIDNNPVVNLIAGLTYYLEVSALDSSLNITESDSVFVPNNDPNIVALSKRVGEYRLLIGTKLTESEAIYYANIFNSIGNRSQALSLPSENGDNLDSSSSTSSFRSMMDAAPCPFECPSCVTDINRWSRLSCAGSNNTLCVDLLVSAFNPPVSFRSLMDSSSSSSYYDIYDPYNYYTPLPPALLPYIDESIGIVFSLANLNKVIYDINLGSGSNPVINLSPIIQFYSDFDFIPEIREVLNKVDGSYLSASLAISRLKNVIPFGCSPVFDGLKYAVNSYNLNDLDPYFSGSKETIYILTDNDENTSDNNPDTVSTEINSLNGAGETPVVVYNINLFKPISIANEASLANAGSLPSLIKQVGGEIINYVDRNSHDRYLDHGVGEAIGSVGYGEFEFVVSFNEEVTVNGISYGYDTPLYTNILWNIESSTDGEYFNTNNAYNNISSVEEKLNIKGKFVKIKFKFIHTFKDSVIDPYSSILSAEVPKISSITIKYNYPRENIIVLNSLNFAADPQQISVSILTENDEFSDIYIGVSSRGSTDWNNYFKESQPFTRNNGKIFVPLRDIGIDPVVVEPLRIINGFTCFAEHGSWNIDSKIKVMDGDQEIDPLSYKSFSSSGEIVFSKSVHLTDPKILITNLKAFSIAIKCINYNSNKAAIIKGISLFSNTNQKLETLNLNRKPVAYNLRFINRPVGVYTPIDIKYNFADLDGDIEDKSKTIIKWYRNGAEVQELANQITFNDLNNPDDITYDYIFTPDASGRIYAEIAQATGIFPEVLAALNNESLFNSGDIIYFTVQPHDSVQYGDIARSEVITVSDTADYPSYIRIRGRLNTYIPPEFGGPGGGSGNSQAITITTLFNKRAILFADFDFYSYELMKKSKIKWYVNGSLWKSEDLINTGIPIFPASYEIYPNDRIGNTIANTIGNIIQVEISVPVDGSADFVIKSDPPIQIVNCLPVVSSARVRIFGDAGSGILTLIPSYVIEDPDIFTGSSQSDQSIVRWYYSINDGVTWIEILRAQPMSNFTPETYVTGQRWKINVTPYDGMQYGESVDSVESTGSSNSSSSSELATICPTKPVDNVTWNKIAQGPTSFMSLTGLRLPTEAEWEYAYRAGTTTDFHGYPSQPNGFDRFPQAQFLNNIVNIAWCFQNSIPWDSTKPVGGKFANGLGLHDMAGNVVEWCQDRYADFTSDSVTDPTGPTTGPSERVIRGGAFKFNGDYSLTAWFRSNKPPWSAFTGVESGIIGFRVAKTAEGYSQMTVLEQTVNPAVVTNVTMQNAIITSGFPWRVQDNETGIEMLLVPAGTFMMGKSTGIDSFPRAHEVTLTKAFYMGRYEVTQAQWMATMGSNPSWFVPANNPSFTCDPPTG